MVAAAFHLLSLTLGRPHTFLTFYYHLKRGNDNNVCLKNYQSLRFGSLFDFDSAEISSEEINCRTVKKKCKKMLCEYLARETKIPTPA